MNPPPTSPEATLRSGNNGWHIPWTQDQIRCPSCGWAPASQAAWMSTPPEQHWKERRLLSYALTETTLASLSCCGCSCSSIKVEKCSTLSIGCRHDPVSLRREWSCAAAGTAVFLKAMLVCHHTAKLCLHPIETDLKDAYLYSLALEGT